MNFLKKYAQPASIFSSVICLILFFQNCNGSLTGEGFNSLEMASNSPTSLVTENIPEIEQPLVPTSKPSLKRLGLIYGPNATPQSLSATQEMGGWYYTYSPQPNRTKEGEIFRTVTAANKFSREFVPMIWGNFFVLDEAGRSCAILEEHVEPGQPLCRAGEIQNSLSKVIALFKSENRPRHIMVLNEPWQNGTQLASVNGLSYLTTPWQAAKIMARIQKIAGELGLEVVSPSIAPNNRSLDWFAEFLKRCHSLETNTSEPCLLSKIRTLSFHGYECSKSFHQNNLVSHQIHNEIISRMQTAQGAPYGNRAWDPYLKSRKVWQTETSCNWDLDFAQAQSNGQYIRTQKESCLRSSGQISGYGSLEFLGSVSENVLERFAWWTTYANPAQDTDVSSVTLSSTNRITAARLVDDSGNLTPMGRVIEALSESQDLKRVNCN